MDYSPDEPFIRDMHAQTNGARRRFWEYLIGERNLSRMTAYTYENGLQRVERFVGKDAAEVSTDDARAFIRESHFHPTTKNSALVALKSYHRWGTLEGLWPPSPIQSVQGPRLIRNAQPSLITEEARALLDLCRSANEYRLVYFGLYAGCRVSEAAGIGEREWQTTSRRRDVSASERSRQRDVSRLRFMGKGRKVREVPVHPELAERRDLILSRSPTPGSLKHTARSIAFTTGIDFGSHTLRRTFAVTLVELGVGRDVVGDLLGHAPATITVQAYASVTWREKAAAIERLSY